MHWDPRDFGFIGLELQAISRLPLLSLSVLAWGEFSKMWTTYLIQYASFTRTCLNTRHKSTCHRRFSNNEKLTMSGNFRDSQCVSLQPGAKVQLAQRIFK